MDTQRLDSWMNLLAGIGSAKDKSTQTFFSGSERLSDELLSGLFEGDHICNTACSLIPETMLMRGFRVENDEERLNDKLKKLDVRQKLLDCLISANLFGGSALLLGVGDSNLRRPLIDGAKRELKFLTVLDRRQLFPKKYYLNPLQANYGEPETFIIKTREGEDEQEIHESRLLIFHGLRKPKIAGSKDFWGQSVLTRVYSIVRDLNLAFSSTSSLVSEASVGVFTINGLHNAVAANQTATIMKRMELVDASKSISRSLVLDENEKYERQTVNFTGLPKVIELFFLRLSSALQIPCSVLFGQPVGLNTINPSTGNDLRVFYDRVQTQQEIVLRPAIEKLISLLGEEGRAPEIIFPALYEPSEKEVAELEILKTQKQKTVYEGLSTLVRENIILPEEAALRLKEEEGFKLDMNSRQELLEKEEEEE